MPSTGKSPPPPLDQCQALRSTPSIEEELSILVSNKNMATTSGMKTGKVTDPKNQLCFLGMETFEKKQNIGFSPRFFGGLWYFLLIFPI